jgi:hypothetical protein
MSSVSPQVETMLGVSASRWFEQPLYWITRIHPGDRERLLARLAAGRGRGYRQRYHRA